MIQEILTAAALTLAFLSLTESLSVLQLAWLISDVTFGVVTTHVRGSERERERELENFNTQG